MGNALPVRHHQVHDEVLQLLYVDVVRARELKIVEAHHGVLQDLAEHEEVRQGFIYFWVHVGG